MSELSQFQTLKSPNAIYCHQEFLEKLDGYRNQPIGKRASLLLQRLAVDLSRVHYKATRGDNQGWRRSRLGGGGGNQFYAWWAPKGAAPLKSFQPAPDGAVFLRDIRHHDDHSMCTPQSLDDHYLNVSVAELRLHDYCPPPWTPIQERFASTRGLVKVLKGHPGSGKTTALLNAADMTGAQRVLYVTYSTELASLARLYFERFCDRNRLFHVVTFSGLLRQLLNSDAPLFDDRQSRTRFKHDLAPHSRSLGMWSDHQDALYEEVHAHIVGRALPADNGRFEKCDRPRVPDATYQQRRNRFLGQRVVPIVTDLCTRLERSDWTPLAERYFPELALAWRAAKSVVAKSCPSTFLEFDCIAIDECQDLTPLETFVLVALAKNIRIDRRIVQFLVAGDEAQTVRPTDFEWGWMNDLLHHSLGLPHEFKLTANLRSPRRIAAVVNKVWDLYSELEKKDRPSGAGFAEIDDDATDQIYYCAVNSSDELRTFLTSLSQREGLALIRADETMPAAIPESLRSSILSAEEAKGLDFHSVCLVDGGRCIERIRKLDAGRLGSADIDGIQRRLAIDRLRVAVSRPSERLIWLDIGPQDRTLQESLHFLSEAADLSKIKPVMPSVILTALDEEQLDLEERIQRCQQDARQLLTVRPEIALSRAQLAVSLLGDPGIAVSIKDEQTRRDAYLTLAEVCLRIAQLNVTLPGELGNPNLYQEAQRAVAIAGNKGLAAVIGRLEKLERAVVENRIAELGYFVHDFVLHHESLPAWFQTSIETKIPGWLDQLEGAVQFSSNTVVLNRILPPFYDALRLPDAARRKQRLLQRSLQGLMKDKKYNEALAVLQKLPERNHQLEGECHKALSDFAQAAKSFREAGNLKEALECYRAIADFDSAASIIDALPQHPAAESYRWLANLRKVIDKRPDNFQKTLTPAEKARLEELLEQALGTARRKPVPKQKAAASDPAFRKRLQMFLHEHQGRRYCDDCLTGLARVQDKTAVAQIGRDLFKEKLFWRGRSLCQNCARAKTCTGTQPVEHF